MYAFGANALYGVYARRTKPQTVESWKLETVLQCYFSTVLLLVCYCTVKVLNSYYSKSVIMSDN